jgi:arylsulfatase A-like enzyme
VTLLLLGAFLAASTLPDGLPASNAAAKGAKRPNVLIIVTDDQRAGPFLMDALAETRRLLGKRGVVFKNAFASLPLCCPSRATIMSGRYAHNHGARVNAGASNLDQSKTLQATLDEAGYRTSIFGKFLNNVLDDPLFFDRWFVFSGGNPYHDFPVNDQGSVEHVDGYSTDVLRKESIAHLETLETSDNKPWFMLVAPTAPHTRYVPAFRHAQVAVPKWPGNPSVAEEDRADKPLYVQNRAGTLTRGTQIAADQYRTLLAVDNMIVRLDRALSRLDERRNTLVFFISDNGYSWGDHGLIGPHYGKSNPYTSSIRVPLLMRWPAEVNARRSRRLVTNADLAPTIYDAVGVEPGYEVDGRSLLDRKWTRRFVFFEHFQSPAHEIPEWASIRYKKAQYTEYYESGVLSFREFYDLETDPWQLVNLLGDLDPLNNPDIVDDTLLVNRLKTCHGTSGDNPCP